MDFYHFITLKLPDRISWEEIGAQNTLWVKIYQLNSIKSINTPEDMQPKH